MEPLTREKTERLYRRLAELTRNEEIKWRRMPADRVGDFVPGDGHAQAGYLASFEGAEFLVLEYETRNYDGNRDEFYFTEQLLMSTLADERRAYDFVFAAGLTDLLDAIKQQVNNIPALVDKILAAASA